MEKIKRLILLSLIVTGFAACHKQQVNPPPPPTPVFPYPAALISPENGQPCASGTSVSATESTVALSWQKADNADSYEVHVRNLLNSNQLVKSTSATSLDVTLLKATPYEWYVVSIKTGVSSQGTSDKWRFFNPGPGVSVYPPYPADAVYPANNFEISPMPFPNTITLQWSAVKGSAEIVNYDIYYGKDKAPPLLAAKVTTKYLQSVSIEYDTTYYWKVVARDSNGNTSTSQVYSFYVL